MRYLTFTIALFSILSCGSPQEKEITSLHCDVVSTAFVLETRSNVALLANRIRSLDSLKDIIHITYSSKGIPSSPDQLNDKVELSYCSNGQLIQSELLKGLSQSDILKAKSGSLYQKFEVLFKSPFAIAHRKELKQIYALARRRYDLFGWGDVAFYDLALYSSSHLIKDSLQAFRYKGDYGEKGYLNSFNHITAQALITSIYSESIADYIADVHEIDNMQELVHGVFSEGQLNHPSKNPVDNYVDMINNEIGQEIGKYLSSRYAINQKTEWTEDLLCDYLNDLQRFYAFAFRISVKPFDPDMELIRKFTLKLNEGGRMKIDL